jgi:hypothetical protein
METWIRGDRAAFQHWALTSYGPIEPLELTIGMLHGLHYEHDRQYSVAGPLIQAKYLLRKPTAGSWPESLFRLVRLLLPQRSVQADMAGTPSLTQL